MPTTDHAALIGHRAAATRLQLVEVGRLPGVTTP